MAEGILIILEGEECREDIKQNFLSLDKVYEYEVLLGVSTDSYDLLGMVDAVDTSVLDIDILTDVERMKNGVVLKYPPYSSKTIKGTSLFELSRLNKLEGETIPTRKMALYNNKLISSDRITGSTIVKKALKNINLVMGDFRQKECIKGWEGFGDIYGDDMFHIYKLVSTCSTGTYVRSICKEIGDIHDSYALAYSIKRLQVGKYAL